MTRTLDEGFWRRTAAARRPLLALDYDGTLAPFRIDRMEARPLEGIEPLLQTVMDHTRSLVAIVSGRPVAELQKLLSVQPDALVGAHGWEFAFGDHPPVPPLLTPVQQLALDQATEAAAIHCPAGRWEEKPASVAIHVRGLESSEGQQLIETMEAAWKSLAAEGSSCLRRFNGGLELRAEGQSKGTALQALRAEWPDVDWCIYVGDDDTDEDAFAALTGDDRGLGIRVGPAEIPTKAGARLAGIEAVRQFLEEWIDVRTNSDE